MRKRFNKVRNSHNAFISSFSAAKQFNLISWHFSFTLEIHETNVLIWDSLTWARLANIIMGEKKIGIVFFSLFDCSSFCHCLRLNQSLRLNMARELYINIAVYSVLHNLILHVAESGPEIIISKCRTNPTIRDFSLNLRCSIDHWRSRGCIFRNVCEWHQNWERHFKFITKVSIPLESVRGLSDPLWSDKAVDR